MSFQMNRYYRGDTHCQFLVTFLVTQEVSKIFTGPDLAQHSLSHFSPYGSIQN